MDWNAILDQVSELSTVYGLKIVYALLILLVGRWIAKFLKGFIKKVMKRANVDDTLISFVGNMAYIALLAFVVLAALGQLGIQTASFIAVIGAAGLAVGLALQGSLSNFAAGVLMIIFRPFKIGDKVDAAGVIGAVEDISIFTTTLVTPDNKVIIVPNSGIMGGNITNYTKKDTLRVDMVIGISYDDDIDKAKAAILDTLQKDDRILKDPAPFIGLVEMADSSVNFTVRPWTATGDYWNVFFDAMENIKKRLDAEGISIPFPQRDVHLYKHED